MTEAEGWTCHVHAEEAASTKILDRLAEVLNNPTSSNHDKKHAIRSMRSMVVNGHSADEALKSLQSFAEKGIYHAMYTFAVMHRLGEGVEPDAVEAARLHKLAAEQGDVFSQIVLARLYYFGVTVQQDLAESERLLELAYGSEDGEALYSLADWHARGLLGEPNHGQMARCLRLASIQGHAAAQCQLGKMCEVLHHRGDRLDMSTLFEHTIGISDAVRLYQMSVDNHGPLLAKYRLGVIYKEGVLVGQDWLNAKYFLSHVVEDDDGKMGESAKERLWKLKYSCFSCHKEGLKTKGCARCNRPRYCSTACQKADWPKHKSVCVEGADNDWLVLRRE